jgi:AbrB family looped-hinge helix DNA binding protein
MKAVSARLSGRCQITLPKDVRQALGVEAGDAILLIVEGDTVTLVPKPASYARYPRGLGKEIWAALGGGDAFIAGERAW